MTGSSPYVLVSICALDVGWVAMRLLADRLRGRFFPGNHPVDEADDRGLAYALAFVCGAAIGGAMGYIVVLFRCS